MTTVIAWSDQNLLDTSRLIHSSADTVTLKDGRLLVVWKSDNKVIGRIHDKAGYGAGKEFIIADPSLPLQFPMVAADEAGGFYVAWLQDENDSINNQDVRLYVQRYDADLKLQDSSAAEQIGNFFKNPSLDVADSGQVVLSFWHIDNNKNNTLMFRVFEADLQTAANHDIDDVPGFGYGHQAARVSAAVEGQLAFAWIESTDSQQNTPGRVHFRSARDPRRRAARPR